ncbi:MAG: hypothetical protein WAT79_07650 [Saprospiraceae bacterium]
MNNALLLDDHFYGFFTGKVTGSSNQNLPPSGFKNIKFDGIETKHFDNTLNNTYLQNDNQNKYVYKVFTSGMLLFVTPINTTLGDANQPEGVQHLIPLELNEKARIGDYGCIPKFESNQAGHIAFSDLTNGIYTIPLIVAVHTEDTQEPIISEFELRPFRMTELNYNRLNALFNNNNHMEGGLYKITGSTLLKLTVDNGIDPELEITEIR